MRTYSLKVAPCSEAEKAFMRAMAEITLPYDQRIECNLGSIFGTPYNEYVIPHEAFLEFKKHFEKERVKGS